MRDLIPTLMQGFQAGAMPGQLRRQAQSELMANELAKLRLQQEPQMFAANMKSKDLANAFQAMLNQEQPQKFGSEQARQALLNRLTNNQIAASDMEIDPQKKVAYYKAVYDALNKLRAEANPSQQVSDISQDQTQVPFRPGINASNLQVSPSQANNLANAGVGQQGYTTDDLINSMSSILLPQPKETPAQKRANDIAATETKQTYAAGLPTRSFNTQNQTSIQAIDNVVPMLKELKTMDIPGQIVGKYWSRTNQAAYLSKLGQIKDTLIKGLGLRPTDSTIQLTQEIAGLQPGENREAYNTKLDKLIAELQKRRANYASNLTTGKFGTPEAETEKIYNMVTKKWE